MPLSEKTPSRTGRGFYLIQILSLSNQLRNYFCWNFLDSVS